MVSWPMRSALSSILSASVALAAETPATAPAASASTAPAAGLAIRSGDVIVFVGDETTELSASRGAQPVYGMLVEGFMSAKYPDKCAKYLNMGWSGDTVRRVGLRLGRDVLSRKATVVVLCLGLNDPGYEGFSAERLEAFKGELAEVVRRCVAGGARVWLISPPAVEEAKATKVRVQRDGRASVADLQAIQYDETLAKYAAAVGEVAAQAKPPAGFVDWHAALLAERQRDPRAQGPAAFTSDGRMPTIRSMALVAGELLKAWGAKPIRVRIELNWSQAVARVSIDEAPPATLPVQMTEDGKRTLELKGLPLPWPMPGGALGSLQDNWRATDMCQFTFVMPDPPELGVVISQEPQRGAAASQSTMLASQLRVGFNLATAEPLRSLQGVKELYDLIGTKNNTQQAIWQRLELAPPAQPELLDSHHKLIEAWTSYIEGYRQLIGKHPKTFDARLILSPAEQPEYLPTSPERPVRTTAPATRPR